MFNLKKRYLKESDENLVIAMVKGSNTAFNELYARYKDRLLYYFYRMLGSSEEKAQDFLQDIFIKVIDNADKFDVTKKFSTWVFSIAHNMCKNEYRRLGCRKSTCIDDFQEVLESDYETLFEFRSVNSGEFIHDLFTELEQFDETHKTVFILHYREGFSLKDISQTLEISEGTVKSRLYYTRKKLAERLAKYQPNYENL